MKEALENLPKILIVLTVGTSIASFVHEWGFYSALGLQLHEVPFSATDQFKTWLTLFPAILGLLAFIQILSTAFVAVTNNNSQETFDEKTPQSRWRRLPKRVRSYIVFFTAFGLIFIGMATLMRQSPLLGSAQLWVAFALYLFHEDIAKPSKSTWIYWAIISAPTVLVALFYVGETSASTRVKNAPTAQILRKIAGDKTEIVSGKILRTYERFILIAEPGDNFSLYSTPDIVSIKFEANPKPESYPCQWFRVLCKEKG